MSCSSSESEKSYDSDDSEINFIPEVEMERMASDRQYAEEDEWSNDENLFGDEPLADQEWTAKYEEEMRTEKELEKKLSDRFERVEPVRRWCTCGKCETHFLQNISECYCCQELEGCVEALRSDLVVAELSPNAAADHPGFNPVCLQRWSLRLAADKYKTKGKQKYRQTGSEDRFLRGVSYREFSRLVYGILGNKRIPLPACAYAAIRKQFPVASEESFRGFDLDEED